jgi:hypothetical protein
MADDNGDDNIISFPSTTPANIDLFSEQSEHQVYVASRKAVYKCVEELMTKIENDESIVGVVCLSFERSGKMGDMMAGDISASTLYVMLEKLKIDVMGLVCDTLGYTDPLMED